MSLFDVQPPAWLANIARPADLTTPAKDIGIGLAGAIKAGQLAKEDNEGKPSSAQKTWLQELPQGLTEARLNLIDPLWKVKVAQQGAMIKSREAQASLALERANMMAQEAELASQEMPLVTDYANRARTDPNTPLPIVRSKAAALELNRLQTNLLRERMGQLNLDMKQHQLDQRQKELDERKSEFKQKLDLSASMFGEKKREFDLGLGEKRREFDISQEGKDIALGEKMYEFDTAQAEKKREFEETAKAKANKMQSSPGRLYQDAKILEAQGDSVGAASLRAEADRRKRLEEARIKKLTEEKNTALIQLDKDIASAEKDLRKAEKALQGARDAGIGANPKKQDPTQWDKVSRQHLDKARGERDGAADEVAKLRAKRADLITQEIPRTQYTDYADHDEDRPDDPIAADKEGEGGVWDDIEGFRVKERK